MNHDARDPISASIFESPVDELLHPELAIWRANVGVPIALDLSPPPRERLNGLDVLCWNVAVGAGRLHKLIERVRRGLIELPRQGTAVAGAAGKRGLDAFGTDPRRPLVLLLQEAYRADETVPAAARGRYHGGAKHPRAADDVADVARAFGLSLRYAPSMRNGAHRSDRGNAILSALPLGMSHAFVLPHVRQRRVVISAELEGIQDLAVMSVHLDVIGRPRPLRRAAPRSLNASSQLPPAETSEAGLAGRAHRERSAHPTDRAGARSTPPAHAPAGDRAARRGGRLTGGRLAQARAVLERIADHTNEHCLIIGADLNTPLGARDPVMRVFAAAGLHRGTRTGRWQHTFHGAVRLALDHVLFRSSSGRIASLRVSRLDEHSVDAGRRVFGSDHHPLLARVTFAEPLEPTTRS